MFEIKKKQTKGKKKLPLVSHTKAYYRFSGTFPSLTDENGYRDNESVRQRPMTGRQKIIFYTALVLCFIAAFIATGVALELSSKEPEYRGAARQEEETAEELSPITEEDSSAEEAAGRE